MLYTNLKHIETAAEHLQIIAAHEKVVVICGRMNPHCVLVYRMAEELVDKYKDVKFFDLEFDNPESLVIRSLPEGRDFSGIPFTIYYKNGIVVKVASGLVNIEEMMADLNELVVSTVN